MAAQTAKRINDATVVGLMLQIKEAENRYDQFAKSQLISQLPAHREMGGHRPTCLAAGGGLSLHVTPGGSLGPPALSPYANQLLRQETVESPQIPKLTPQGTASIA